MSKWTELRRKLKIIDESYNLTKTTREKYFNKVKDNIPLIKGYNYMADLLFLHTTKENYRYLLVMVDLATDAFDIEPLTNKESKTVLNAMLKMFSRPYLSIPYASIRTDEGSEFMGVFHKWLYDHNILHKRGLVGRHTQLANVERLNRTLGELFVGYMNTMEIQNRQQYHEWTDILPDVRRELNAIRLKPVPTNLNTYEYPVWDANNIPPKYNVGDLVYVKLTEPRNALGYKQTTKNFRAGDIRWSREPKRINKVLYYTGKIPYRYMVNTYEQVSYTEAQLRPATEREEETVIKKIIGEKTIRGQKHYKIWWQGELKKDSTYEPAEYIEQVAPILVGEYNSV